MSALVWIPLVTPYLTALVVLPLLWIVGALMQPTADVAAAEAGSRL